MKLYPRAHESRVKVNDPTIRPQRRALLKAAARNFIYLQLLFLGLFSYIFGSLYQQTSHTHNLNVLYVDYDNGPVGAAIRNAYKNLLGDSFPSLIERPASEFATPDDLRREVCETRYWAALYTSHGASDHLQAALAGSSAAYDKSDVISYVWNEARYSPIIDAAISANLEALSSEARVVYATGNWTEAIQNATAATFSVFADPWQLKSINIQPTTQGSRLIYNTLVIILILIQEFFFLGTLNSLYEAFKIYHRLNPHRIILVRNLLSLAYTFVGSLCTTGAVWAFRGSWKVNGNQFALSWAILWLFAHVNFLTLDLFSIWLPPPFVPMALITWVVLNVTSILLPFGLSPSFYHWGYAMPAHEVYQTLIDIWSGGCNPKLSYALPILFIYEISGLVFTGIGVHRRAHYAVIKEEQEKHAFQMRLDTAMAAMKQLEEERRKEGLKTATRASSEINATDENHDEEMDARQRSELAESIHRVDSEIRRVETRSDRTVNFGPSFGFAFGSGAARS